MPQYSPTYKFGYFKRGSNYSADTDYKRFVTLDYNLESYMGIVGIGVINGWEIEQGDSPLTIKILPGAGIISGYYSESEYTFKQRSEIVSGEREVEVIEDDNIPESPLTGSERANYISVRQEYEPSYNPSPSTIIINSYIKVVVPYVITLNDNSDTYIIAEQKYPTSPFPSCVGTPIIGDRPISSSYGLYSDFKAAITEYDLKLKSLKEYKWRENLENHFTAVNFSKTSTYFKTPSKVLLGKVVTRNGIIKKIDVKSVDNLANLNSSIKIQASKYVNDHIHGGSQSFDPEKINLKTDIRKCVSYFYLSNGQVTNYIILENEETSTNIGHRHQYSIDSTGNGYTFSMIGTDKIHFHKIKNYIVGDQEYNLSGIQTHNHTILTTQQPIDPYVAYSISINGIPISSNNSVDLSNKKLNIYGLSGQVYKTYSCSIPIVIDAVGFYRFDSAYGGYVLSKPNPGEVANFTAETAFQPGSTATTNSKKTIPYLFELSSASVLDFMNALIIDFTTKYNNYKNNPSSVAFDEGTYYSTLDQYVSFDFLANPFTVTKTADSANELILQSAIAQELLQKNKDIFTFTPNVANRVSVVLKESFSTDPDNTVKIEIMDSEVHGILKEENIIFINAEKFTMGIFDIANIPIINHIGRMGEEFLPVQYPLVSTDGIKYSASPNKTTFTQDHYHKLNLDETLSGSTINTYISEDPIYYAYSNTASYFIAHSHGVNNEMVLPSTNKELSKWQFDIHGTNVSSAHTHDIIESVKTDPKIIYSIAETANGSILAGTSAGLYIIPSDNAYLFVINGIKIYQIGDSLWDLLLSAKAEYELQSSNQLVVTEDIYLEKISKAQISLVADGDSTLIYGYVDPVRGQDQIMIQRVSYFEMPNFGYVYEKPISTVNEKEKIVMVKYVYKDGTFVTAQDIVSGKSASETLGANIIAVIKVDFQDVPVWSIHTTSGGDVFTCGSTTYAKNTNIESNLYSQWSNVVKPSNISSMKKLYGDSQNNIWIPSENGLFVARNYQNGNMIETVDNPSFYVSTQDVIEGAIGKIYKADESGINLSVDYGKTWISVFTVSGGCIKLFKDAELNILYAVDKYQTIYSSEDGNIWNKIGFSSFYENGDFIAFKGFIYACTENGIYRMKAQKDEDWDLVFPEKVYSLYVLKDNSMLLAGCNNCIYATVDGEIYTKIEELAGSSETCLYEQNFRKNYDYAYLNKKQQFFFKETFFTDNSFSSLIDFNLWIAKNGIWKSESKNDIYINRNLVYSSKKEIDNKEKLGYSFDINAHQGNLDFGKQTNLTDSTSIFSQYISVEDSSGFSVGDRIVVSPTSKMETNPPSAPIPSASGKTLAFAIEYLKYIDNLSKYYSTVSSYGEVFLYADVSGVSTGKIFVDRNIDTVIEIPATVCKIPKLSGNSQVFANIYESNLTNIGANIHSELDDKTSYATNNLPYQLNNSFLSNLLQLTQAVKYAAPNIDDYFVNSKFFDFKYSWNKDDLILPYIGDDIDLYNCEAYNSGIYDSDYVMKKSMMINKIFIGHGQFNGTIFVGTDIGIFYSKISDSLEANWFYIYALPFPTYDFIILNDNILIAATSNGVYKTTDLTTWVIFNQAAIKFPVYCLSYRWKNRETVTIPSHNATFLGNYISSSLPEYANILPNRIIRVSGTTDNDGCYSVISSGSGIIQIAETFHKDDSYSDVIIEMGAWWEFLQDGISTNNPNIRNTLIAGGKSMFSYATNTYSTTITDEITWNQSQMSGLTDFSAVSISNLSNGDILTSVSGISGENNNLMICTGDGGKWENFKQLQSIKGTILGKEITNFGNTILSVNFTSPTSFKCEDYSLNSMEIGFFNNASLLLKTNIFSNETRNGIEYLTIMGQGIIDVINKNPSLSFTVYPIKVNKIVEANNNDLFYGTNYGLYTDSGSTINFSDLKGTIVKVADGGVITKIDLNGIIKSISLDSTSGKMIVGIYSPDIITSTELIGKTLFAIDSNDYDIDPETGEKTYSEAYKIVANSSSGSTGEFFVTLESKTIKSGINYGKHVTIVGDKSKVYVTFDSLVKMNQFNGGKFYLSSNVNNNYATQYNISYNTEQYLLLNFSIPPKYTSDTSNNNTSPVIGQTIKIIDSSGKIKLYVSFDNETELNQLNGYSFSIDESNSPVLSDFAITSNDIVDSILNQDMYVYSNTINEIILDNFSTISDNNVPFSDTISQANISNSFSDSASLSKLVNGITLPPPILQFVESSRFILSGNRFSQCKNFNNNLLSISSDHYHSVSLMNEKLTGEISSVAEDGPFQMNITFINSFGFDNNLLLSDGTIIEGCKIIIYNPNNISYTFETSTISYSGGVLKVKIYDQNIWDVTGYNQKLISDGWYFVVESQFSGMSNGTYYKDFETLTTYLTADVIDGDGIINVESTVGINVNDKIEMFDIKGRTLIFYVKSIIGSDKLETNTPITNYFQVANNAGIKVLKDSFSNSHIHRIKNAQVETIIVQEYLDLGYPSAHSHVLSPYITNISDMITYGDQIFAVGSSEFIYMSYNNGKEWNKRKMKNLNESLEWNNEISSISKITMNGNKIIVGTTNGQIFSNTIKEQNNVPLEKDI